MTLCHFVFRRICPGRWSCWSPGKSGLRAWHNWVPVLWDWTWLNIVEHGAPTTQERLILVEPTHGNPTRTQGSTPVTSEPRCTIGPLHKKNKNWLVVISHPNFLVNQPTIPNPGEEMLKTTTRKLQSPSKVRQTHNMINYEKMKQSLKQQWNTCSKLPAELMLIFQSHHSRIARYISLPLTIKLYKPVLSIEQDSSSSSATTNHYQPVISNDSSLFTIEPYY